jgi:ribosomal protein S18 acetylase RimI-like enzyme
MDVSVRDAVPEDAVGIAAVHTRTWQHAYAHIFPAEQLASIREDRRAEGWSRLLLERPEATHTLVAAGPQGVVGFAFLGTARDESEPLGELYAIYVLPEASGRGIGRALMAETVSRLRGDGYEEAILWVLEDNSRTRHFYEAAGWHADGGIKDESMLDTAVRELRYRIALGPSRLGASR